VIVLKYNVLIVEDQMEISNIVTKYLESDGFNTYVAKDGFEALSFFNSLTIHLMILDIMLPGIDGYDVLREVRKISEIPVIMLTAKQDEADRLKGFDTGADDYVVKPFSVKELVKRVQVLINRVYHDNEEIIYTCRDLKLYTQSMKLYRNDVEISLTSAEYSLMLVMFKSQGQVLNREQLIELAFGNSYEGYDRNVDSYIKRIRQKIEVDSRHPQYLITKYGAGYVFGGEQK
jgi:DNA-binding response OmpR family regulator